MRKTILSLTLSLISISCFCQNQKFIHCGKLIDVENQKVLEKMTIVIEDNLIKSVISGYASAPKEATVIDLKNKTVLPGLMDMHVHIESESSPKAYEDRFRNNEADVALKATTY
ncbi:MAG TPA: amidohydrolase family protein, partial [Saprospiraceae bacterium]|nr:amidohydrolase family protein [Saprospiraceae bacterium]